MTDDPSASATSNDPMPPSDAARPRGASRRERARESRQATRQRSLRQQWRQEFPYHWQEDDIVTRRDTLRFLVAGTGALFLATGTLALAGSVPPAATRPVVIARVGELAPNQWRVFNFPNQFAQGILINVPGKGLVCYSDVCTHLSCAVLYDAHDGLLHCPCHDGVYSAITGEVLAGPPPRPLPLIQLTVLGQTIYAVKEVQR